MMSEGKFILCVVLAIVLFIGAMTLTVRQVAHHYAQNSCRTYEVQTHRETRFADWNFWDWSCLTKTADGRWIPIGQLREFGENR